MGYFLIHGLGVLGFWGVSQPTRCKVPGGAHRAHPLSTEVHGASGYVDPWHSVSLAHTRWQALVRFTADA